MPSSRSTSRATRFPRSSPSLMVDLPQSRRILATEITGWRYNSADTGVSSPSSCGPTRTRSVLASRSKGRATYHARTHDAQTRDWASQSARSSSDSATSETADLVHVRWPDGVMQCELNTAANQRFVLTENNRKTGSCPVLFTWNGERFVCLGDFLGGGGLGYLVAPGVYSQPDRDEAVAIAADQLIASRASFVSRSPNPWTKLLISITCRSTSSIGRRACRQRSTSGSLRPDRGRPASCSRGRRRSSRRGRPT